MLSSRAALLGVAIALVAHAEPQMLSGDGVLSGPTPLSEFSVDSMGPLKELIGTWEGKLGLNVVRVPNVERRPPGRTASKVTIVQEYQERVTFTPIMGAILNRGFKDANHFDPPTMLNQTLLGLLYLQEVRHLDSDGGQLIHAENGQWLYQAAPGIDSEWSVARFAMIPHSPGLIAVGPTRKLDSGEDVVQAIDEVVESFGSTPLNVGDAPFGYGELHGNPQLPVGKLKQDMGPDLANMKAVELTVTTTTGRGTVAMLRNPKVQVLNEAFDSKFWIQTVSDEYGDVSYQQLQYAQSVNMNFGAKFAPECESTAAASSPACIIRWPHTQVNTLRKVQTGLQDTQDTPDSDARFPYIR